MHNLWFNASKTANGMDDRRRRRRRGLLYYGAILLTSSDGAANTDRGKQRRSSASFTILDLVVIIVIIEVVVCAPLTSHMLPSITWVGKPCVYRIGSDGRDLPITMQWYISHSFNGNNGVTARRKFSTLEPRMDRTLEQRPNFSIQKANVNLNWIFC